jgi:hypothetical protein
MTRVIPTRKPKNYAKKHELILTEGNNMKKYLLFLLFGVSLYAQTLTEKWNTYLSRYEYYNSSGVLIGYKTYNQYTRSWEYYENKPIQQVVRQDENFALLAQVGISRQQRYDRNKQRLQNAVDDIYKRTPTLGYPKDVYISSLALFQAQYIDQLNKGSYDLSFDEKTNELINWLYNGINSLLASEFQAYNAEQEKIKADKTTALQKIAYLDGNYTTTLVKEEKWNPNTKKYEVVKTDTALTKLYMKLGEVWFARDKSPWKIIQYNHILSDDRVHVVLDVKQYTLMIFDNNMSFIEFYEEGVGNVYMKRYTYQNLKKQP